ncbi:DUF4254 domain-containing protein [Nocardia transvalensis]|uniref:DUF4254 domain-containing protein n=1 Tax=Nocardia transvalensis TaxID=37333 RepID=UPI00189557E7|nr:DUF4254 domain-containing protein [Nocardia transvalensis]MBF6328437.1 DUF4254 domain-containing protein [Nocardia transvalensis]
MNPTPPLGLITRTSESAVVAVSFGFRSWRVTVGSGVEWSRDRQPGEPAVVRRVRSRRTRFAAAPAVLPSAADIVAACDPTADHPTQDPIVGAVRSLARLAAEDHAHATGHDDDADELALTHDELLETIDRIIGQRLPLPLPRERWDAAVHTETLAPVISRLVTLAVTRAAMTRQVPGPDRVADELDTALADLRTAYDQLVTELLSGRRRLPRYQSTPAV